MANARLPLAAARNCAWVWANLLTNTFDLRGELGRIHLGGKLMTMAASTLGGGDCFDDALALPSEGIDRVLGWVDKTPFTVGRYRWGYVRQLAHIRATLDRQYGEVPSEYPEVASGAGTIRLCRWSCGCSGSIGRPPEGAPRGTYHKRPEGSAQPCILSQRQGRFSHSSSLVRRSQQLGRGWAAILKELDLRAADENSRRIQSVVSLPFDTRNCLSMRTNILVEQ